MLRAHGLEGEFRVVPFSIELLNIRVGATVFITGQAHRIEALREVPGGLILTTDRVRSRESAAVLQDELVEVRDEDLAPLEDGAYYVAELIGLKAFDESGAELGTLTEVMATGANDVYVVEKPDGGELLLPAISDVVLQIDVSGGVIRVRPMDTVAKEAIDEST